MKKSGIIWMCSMLFALSAAAQMDAYSIQLKIHPDSANTTGCVIYNTQFRYENVANAQTPSLIFNTSEFFPVNEKEQYFNVFNTIELFLKLTNPGGFEEVLNYTDKNVLQLTGELNFNGNLIPVDIACKYLNTPKQQLKELTFELDNVALRLEHQGVTKFTLLIKHNNL